MLNYILSFVLVTVLLNVVMIHTAYAKWQGPESVERTEKVKAKVGRLYARQKRRVRVKLEDGRKLKGYIGEAKEDYFIVVDPKAGTATAVRYTQVKELKPSKPSSILSIVVAGGALGLLILSFLLSPGS